MILEIYNMVNTLTSYLKTNTLFSYSQRYHRLFFTLVTAFGHNKIAPTPPTPFPTPPYFYFIKAQLFDCSRILSNLESY